MAALYVVSAQAAAGKTAICAGMGKSLQDAGKKVGFLKPGADGGDAAFMNQVLALPEAVESLSPPAGDISRVKEAFARVAAGKDVVLLEGRLDIGTLDAARELDARVIVIEDYSQPAEGTGYEGFSPGLLGVIVNKVPTSQMERVRVEAAARLGGAGIKVLGVLPEARALAALTVGQLAESIQGKILNNSEKSSELAQNYMLGAMVVGSGLDYFGRKADKAAVIRNDRPDMQLAALETPTRCLVIAGGAAQPIYSVRYKAEKKGIPIILAEGETNTVVAGIEAALNNARFSKAKKLPKLVEIMRQQLDLRAIYGSLGLAA
ncbi:MAG: DRTGG domain-containing protein [Chloroflexota bacterium]